MQAIQNWPINLLQTLNCKFIINICFADALHAYFGLCGMSLMQEPGLNSIHPALNITQRAADHLNELHCQMNR